MQQFLLYKAHCSDERGEEGGGQHSCLEGKQFKQFTTYFTVKERKGGNLLSDGRRRRNGNGSISGARPCIDIAPPLQLLDLDPPRARSGISPLIRRNGAFSLAEEEGMEEGVKSAAAAYSVSPSLLSSPFLQTTNRSRSRSTKTFYGMGAKEKEEEREGEWSISEMLSSCLASGK